MKRTRSSKRELTVEQAALVAELRQIEADHRAAGEADRAAFREAWAAKMAADPEPKPIRVSKLVSTR